MIFYLLFLLSVLLLCFTSAVRNSISIYYVLVILLVCFAGFRYETGYDWPVYNYFFNSDPGDFHIEFEPGLILIKNFASLLDFGFDEFLFIVAGVQVLAVCYSIRYLSIAQKAAFLFLYVAFLDLFILSNFAILRQGLSLGFAWIALSYFLIEKRFAPAILCLCVAVSFHYSALFLLLIPILHKLIIKTSPVLSIAFVLLWFFSYFGVDPLRPFLSLVLYGSYLDYIDLDNTPTITLYKTIVFIFLITAYFFVDFILKKCPSQPFSSSFVRLPFFLFLLLYPMPTLSSRIVPLVSYPLLVYLSDVATFEFKGKQVFILLFIVYSFFSYSYFFTRPMSEVFVPYQTWLNSTHELDSTGKERTRVLLELIL